MAEFKVGDKVIATTPFLGEKKDRDGFVKDVQANRYGVGFSYRVEVVVAGDTTSYWLTADKLRLAQTPAETTFKEDVLDVVLSNAFPDLDEKADLAWKKTQALLAAKKEVEPPADPPKKERIRRTKEEIELGIPPEQVPAYRADPSSWSKRASGETDFNNTIEKALDDHWEDKAQEYLAPEQIAQRLGWIGFYEKEIGYIYKHVEHSELVLLDEGDWTIAVNDSDASHKCTWSGDEDFRMWLMRCTERIEELLDGGVCDDNDLEGNDKPAADVSVLETTEPELMPQMEIDSLKPEVYNYEVMGEVPDGYVLARERFNGIRWYVMYFKDAKRLAYLPGTTSVDDNTSQPPAYLTKWRYDMVARYGSVDAMEGFVDDTAAYGTIMHTLIAWYINGSLPVIGSQSWKDQVCMLITLQDGRIPDIYYPLWDRRLRKDLTCWNQFMIDRNVKVHLMEFACGSTDLGVAGQIDLVCTMDFNRARVNAILDMKSGKKSTGQGNTKATQLGIYKLLFDRVFPDWKYGDTGKSPMGITKFFNWHPNDYSEVPSKDTGLVVPTYELVNQTDSVDWKEIDLQMKLFKHRTQGVKPGSNARFSIEGELKPFTDNQDLIKGGLRQDTYIEKYGLEVCDD